MPLLRAAEGCKVKKTIAAQPTIEASTVVAPAPAETTATPP